MQQRNENLFEDEEICFYKLFPLQQLTVASLMRYMLDALSTANLVLVVLATLIVSAVGLLVPKLNNLFPFCSRWQRFCSKCASAESRWNFRPGKAA